MGGDLMPEVTHAGQHHHNTAFVSRGDHFVIAHAATWLNDASCAHVNHNI
jgi:hypothetical protein